MAYISDSTVFSTVNASVNTAIATPLPQGAVNFYYPTMAVNTWYRYYDVDSTNVIETGSFLSISSLVSEQNGIIQKLSNLIVGSVYNIQIDFHLTVVGTVNLLIYSGTTLQSTHVLSGSTSQTIEFTANSTQDTIVIDTENLALLQIDSISITTIAPSIPYMTGYTVKPFSISTLGDVTFTDGRNSLNPNQLQCEAYGYTYDNASGTCSAFRFSTNLDRGVANGNNKTYGVGNTTETGTNNSIVMGENNTVRGFSRNSIITGNQNVISNSVNNANITGTLGEATADNSIVLGGNAGNDSLGERQNITVMYGTQTDNNSTVDSYLNNTTGSYFKIPDNSIVVFQTETIAVRIGGSGGGNPGDFKAIIEIGAAVNKSGVLSIDSSRTVIASSGTTSGWISTVGVSGTNFIQQVKGANNRDIMWATTIRFTQIKTGVTL
tara:strand:- start:1567 stop:2874 length:1308 start_codon:yes stop_codon:yes gene_type:complete